MYFILGFESEIWNEVLNFFPGGFITLRAAEEEAVVDE